MNANFDRATYLKELSEHLNYEDITTLDLLSDEALRTFKQDAQKRLDEFNASVSWLS